MPQNDSGRTSVKQTRAILQAAQSLIGVTAKNPKRNYLKLYNSGANPLNYWFEDSEDYGQSVVLAPGQTENFYPVPIERLSLSSTLGSTVSILEGYEIG